MQVPPKTTVRFPNLFAGYLNEEPTINPNYVAVKATSERRIYQYVYTHQLPMRKLADSSSGRGCSLLRKSEESSGVISLILHLS